MKEDLLTIDKWKQVSKLASFNSKFSLPNKNVLSLWYRLNVNNWSRILSEESVQFYQLLILHIEILKYLILMFLIGWFVNDLGTNFSSRDELEPKV